MENEEDKPVENKPVDNTTDYIKVIEDMKENSVAKEDYDKLKDENAQLISTLSKRNYARTEPEKKVDIDKLRDDLFHKDLSNLEYAKKTLELRNELLKTGKDPFLPNSKYVVWSKEDKAKANEVAEAIQSCIDCADGNSEIFTRELQRIMVDIGPINYQE